MYFISFILWLQRTAERFAGRIKALQRAGTGTSQARSQIDTTRWDLFIFFWRKLTIKLRVYLMLVNVEIHSMLCQTNLKKDEINLIKIVRGQPSMGSCSAKIHLHRPKCSRGGTSRSMKCNGRKGSEDARRRWRTVSINHIHYGLDGYRCSLFKCQYVL